MPSAQAPTPPASIKGGNDKARTSITEPLINSGSLDSYEQNDATPIIGREILGLQIKDILNSSNAKEQIRDLAITGKYELCSFFMLNYVVASHFANSFSIKSRSEVWCFSEIRTYPQKNYFHSERSFPLSQAA